MRTSSGDYEVLYYDVANKEPHVHLHAADKEWASNSVKVGDDRSGIKPAGEDGTHVNDVCGSADKTLLFSSDDFSLVNVFRFPNPSINESRSFCGHSEHVTRVTASQDGKTVFTVGGNDKALIQWRLTKGEQHPVKEVIEEIKEPASEEVKPDQVVDEVVTPIATEV